MTRDGQTRFTRLRGVSQGVVPREIELQERQVRQESDRLKAVHPQIEAARQNAVGRIREMEATVVFRSVQGLSNLQWNCCQIAGNQSCRETVALCVVVVSP